MQVTQPKSLEGGSLRSYQLGGLKFLLSLYNNKINGASFDQLLNKGIKRIE